jgi:hypothetical protein
MTAHIAHWRMPEERFCIVGLSTRENEHAKRPNCARDRELAMSVAAVPAALVERRHESTIPMNSLPHPDFHSTPAPERLRTGCGRSCAPWQAARMRDSTDVQVIPDTRSMMKARPVP